MEVSEKHAHLLATLM